SCLSSQLTFVPIHSLGPSTTCHSTCVAGWSSRTFMSKKPRAPNWKWIAPPALLSPLVSSVHQPARPSHVDNALYTLSRDDLIPTLWRISAICDSSFIG